MKEISQRSRGFTIIEMIIVMVIIGVILSAVIAVGQGATDTSRITSTVATVKALQTAAVNYYNANGGTYSGGSLGDISLANLAAQNMLPGLMATSGVNAWKGTIAIQPDANNASYFQILLTNVPSSAQAPLQNAVSNLVQSVPSYSASTQTWSAEF